MNQVMNRSKFQPLVVVFALAALMISCGGSKPSSSADRQQVAVTSGATSSNTMCSITLDTTGIFRDTIRLGRIFEGEKVRGTFYVKNHTTQPMILSDVITGCGCTTTEYTKEPIESGKSRKISFTFDSKSRDGYQLKTIDVISSDKLRGRVFIEAEVIRPKQ